MRLSLRHAHYVADILAWGGAYWLAGQSAGVALATLLMTAAVFVAGAWALGLYTQAVQRVSYFLPRVTLLLGLPAAALLLVARVSGKPVAELASVLAVVWLLDGATRAGVSYIAFRRYRHPYHTRHIVLVADAGSAERLRELLEDAEPFCKLVAWLPVGEGLPPLSLAELHHLRSNHDLREYIFKNPVDVVLFAVPPAQVESSDAIVRDALQIGLAVAVLIPPGSESTFPPSNGIHQWRDRLGRQWVLMLSEVRHPRTYLALKRVVDVVLAGAALVVLSPFLLLLALLVKVTSPGPVLYVWRVVGKNRKPFVGYKFRTMVHDAESLREALLSRNEMSGPVFKIRNDPRVTPLGTVLRRYSLDELPQLVSVLKGDMSLVGPRPAFPHEADGYEFWQRRKLAVTPGITCFWQVNGRNTISSFREWATLDLQYIDQASVAVDCKILAKTALAVVRRNGAY